MTSRLHAAGDQVGRGSADDVGGHVGHQGRELTVAQHAAQVGAQRVTGLALDLIHPVHQGLQGAKVLDPLGRGLLTHAGDAGQVVAAVAAQRREVRVLRRRQAVFPDKAGRVVALHVGDATAVVQHRDVVVDQLEGVPVPGDDEDVHLVLDGLGRERRDDVVGLEAGGGQVPHPERVKDLQDQAELAEKAVGGLGTARLVRVVLLMAERWLPAVERHRDMRRLLVAQHVDEHRGEAVNGVRRQAGRGGEVLLRERVERPVRQGVPIEQQEPVSHGSYSMAGPMPVGSLYGRRADARRFTLRPPVAGGSGNRGSQVARTRFRDQRPFDENAKIVVDVIVAPAASTVDGKFGWLGESGKCWVSNV